MRPRHNPRNLFAREIIWRISLVLYLALSRRSSNMADRLNIQDAVLRVVENLHSLNRHQPSPPGPSSSAVSATVTDELNRSFQIPRRSRPRDSSTLNENESGIHLNASVPPSFQNLATGFSTSQNYSTVQTGQRRRRQNRTPYGRFSGGRISHREEQRVVAKPDFKDVCLLPSPQWSNVPRGKAKLCLINGGMYVDAWYFHKDWEETTLREEIRKLFGNLLKNSSGEDIG